MSIRLHWLTRAIYINFNSSRRKAYRRRKAQRITKHLKPEVGSVGSKKENF